MKRTINQASIETVLERVRAVEALIGRHDAPVDKIMEDLGDTPEDVLSASDWNTLDEGHYAAHKLAQTVRELLSIPVTELVLEQEARNAS